MDKTGGKTPDNRLRKYDNDNNPFSANNLRKQAMYPRVDRQDVCSICSTDTKERNGTKDKVLLLTNLKLFSPNERFFHPECVYDELVILYGDDIEDDDIRKAMIDCRDYVDFIVWVVKLISYLTENGFYDKIEIAKDVLMCVGISDRDIVRIQENPSFFILMETERIEELKVRGADKISMANNAYGKLINQDLGSGEIQNYEDVKIFDEIMEEFLPNLSIADSYDRNFGFIDYSQIEDDYELEEKNDLLSVA